MCAILSPLGCCGRAKGCPTTAATAPPPGADRDAEPLRVLGHNHKTGSWLVGAMLYCATNAKVMRICIGLTPKETLDFGPNHHFLCKVIS